MTLPPALLRHVSLLCLLSSTSVLGGCVRDCGFKPHCEGNTLMDCTYGVDQLAGSGSPRIYPCLEPSPVCVERRDESSSPFDGELTCARAPLTECDDSFADTCEGATLHVFCLKGYITADDCSDHAGTGRCVSTGGRARCD